MSTVSGPRRTNGSCWSGLRTGAGRWRKKRSRSPPPCRPASPFPPRRPRSCTVCCTSCWRRIGKPIRKMHDLRTMDPGRYDCVQSYRPGSRCLSQGKSRSGPRQSYPLRVVTLFGIVMLVRLSHRSINRSVELLMNKTGSSWFSNSSISSSGTSP